MGIIAFLIIGIIAGWLAGKIIRGGGFGIIGNMAVGVVGAVIGGFIFSFVGITTGGWLGSIVTATVGALVLLFLVGLIKGK
ncbi:MAG: GlsB/YeaQ/YmgE family stress response membrane protein [Gammaproteobacteria bacterium]|nr:GlsB/YeaQ/YmgE family stress response membrane protein [Gammaproteobacteria bacterium]